MRDRFHEGPPHSPPKNGRPNLVADAAYLSEVLARVCSRLSGLEHLIDPTPMPRPEPGHQAAPPDPSVNVGLAGMLANCKTLADRANNALAAIESMFEPNAAR